MRKKPTAADAEHFDLTVPGRGVPADIEGLQSVFVEHKKAAEGGDHRDKEEKAQQVHLLKLLSGQTQDQKQKEQDADGVIHLVPVPLTVEAVKIVRNCVIQDQRNHADCGKYAGGPAGFELPGAKEQVPDQRDNDQDIGQHETYIIGAV